MAKVPFSSFVIFAEMRTGSNFLEANLNAIPGVKCHGEAFNPYFIGGEGKQEMLGVTIEQRGADPRSL
ncbi:MAG: nodulation protein NodH, partial [Rhodobacteraceae bacterium]|nr:nodulation protein NodH [Paracoccaceae bacterium]